jgi:hypothetical protein
MSVESKGRYVGNVDELVARTTPQQAAAHIGYDLPVPHSTVEQRIPCVFSEDCRDSSYGNLTVNLDQAANPIYCHACGIRGNLLTLMFGMKHGRPPHGGKLRGDEFKEMVQLLQEINGSEPQTTPVQSPTPTESNPPSEPAEPARNISLKDSDNERVRELVSLDEQLLVDPGVMSPKAAAYFRERLWLTPEVAHNWRMGYLPNSAKGLLRGRVVYGYANEQNDVLSWFGRDPTFAEKDRDWLARGKPEKGKPIKTRFVKGFHRGLELYGQHGADRLAKNPRLRKSLDQFGLVVTEGPNDVIRLDCLDVAAVGLCSNKVTEEQLRKLTAWSRQLAGGQITVMLDNDPEGEAGAKDLAWKLLERRLDVRLAWSSQMHDGQFAGRQPESLTEAEWADVIVPSFLR